MDYMDCTRWGVQPEQAQGKLPLLDERIENSKHVLVAPPPPAEYEWYSPVPEYAAPFGQVAVASSTSHAVQSRVARHILLQQQREAETQHVAAATVVLPITRSMVDYGPCVPGNSTMPSHTGTAVNNNTSTPTYRTIPKHRQFATAFVFSVIALGLGGAAVGVPTWYHRSFSNSLGYYGSQSIGLYSCCFDSSCVDFLTNSAFDLMAYRLARAAFVLHVAGLFGVFTGALFALYASCSLTHTCAHRPSHWCTAVGALFLVAGCIVGLAMYSTMDGLLEDFSLSYAAGLSIAACIVAVVSSSAMRRAVDSSRAAPAAVGR